MKKMVFHADALQVEEIQAMVRSRKYPNVSAFLRKAVDEKLRRLKRTRSDDCVDGSFPWLYCGYP